MRTRETADIALEGRAIPRLVVPELDDVKVGDFEGKNVEEMRRWQRDHGPTAAPPGGGESRVDALSRYIDGYRKVLAREEPAVLVVAHGRPITAVLLAARGEGIPLTLEGVQVEPAQPHPVTANELAAALRTLRQWIRGVEQEG